MQSIPRSTLSPALALVLLLAGCAGSQRLDDAADEGWITLFDGTSLDGWTMAGPGHYTLEPDGSMLGHGGMGLFFHNGQPFRNFVMEIDWKAVAENSNSGIFVRFPDTTDPWDAVNMGYEIQIDDSRDPMHKTGSVYSFSAPFKDASNGPGAWNTYRIEVVGQRYKIYLNDALVNDFVGWRSEAGHVGVQNHDDASKVWYRNIRVKPLPDTGAAPSSLADLFAVDETRDPIRVLMVTATHGYRHGPAIDTSRAVLAALSERTEFAVDFTEDLDDLNTDNLSRYDLLLFANSTLRMPDEAEADDGGAAEASLTGSWNTWDVEIPTPNGPMQGRLALSGTPDDLSGRIQFSGFPDAAPLQAVVLDGQHLSFQWNGDQFGTITAKVDLADEALTGMLDVGGQQVPISGTMAAAATGGAWAITIPTPEGDMNGTLTIDGDALTGTLAVPTGTSPLNDVTVNGGGYTFNFDGGPQYGPISGRVMPAGDALTGVLVVGGAEVPFTGRSNTPSAAAPPEEGPRVTADQQAAILAFLRAGKGIVGVHAALDALYGWEAYREMVGGGLFESHPWTQSVRIKVEEPGNPAMAHLGDGFWIRDEIYVLDQNPRMNARVLASLDMRSVGVDQGPADRGRNDHPISWIRNHEGGRVFMTKLGHFPDVWTTPAFLEHLLQGMRMAAGRVPASFSGHMVKETIAENVWPDDLAVDDQGNVWIAELRGKVHRYDAATGQTTLIAEIPTTNPEKIEHGLYGIEVDPDFYDGAPYVYAYYAERETFINTLSRFTYRDGRLDLASEQVILRVPTEPQCCHQAGDIEWGPDGTLYLSTGDTGMSETRPAWELSEDEIEAFVQRNDLKDYHWARLADSERSAQNLQDLRGKILRINRDGTIPKDNPFYGEPGVRWEIYAYGLRNPYRFKVDHQTGALYIGVVGPDASYDYDEYNIATEGGENFGWPRTLGRLFYNEWTPEDIPDYVPPAWEYTYEGGGRSATVGPIYRHDGPGAFPPNFQNKVFLFDWSRRWIKYADVDVLPFTNDTENDVRNNPLQYTRATLRFVDIKMFDQLTDTAPISMELGPDGALYLAEFDGFWDAGPNARVTRYRWVSDDDPAAPPSSGGR